MKEKKQRNPFLWYRSILIKYLLILLFLLFTFTSVFLCFYRIFQTETTDTTAQLTLSRDIQVLSEVENRLNEIEDQVYELYNGRNLNLLSALWDYDDTKERAKKISDVQDQLEWIRSKDNFATNLKVYLRKNRVFIESRQYGSYTEELETELNQYLDKAFETVVKKEALYIYIRQLSSGLRYKASDYISEIQIPREYFANMLQELYKSDQSQGMILVGDTVLADLVDLSIREEILQKYQANKESFDESGTFDMVIGKEKYFCSIAKVKAYDMVLITIHESNQIFGKMLTLFRVLPFILVMNLIIIIFFLKHMDRYIKQMVELQRAQLKQLQAQIDPHFLYNTLFILRTRALRQDCGGVETLAGLLGEYFQFLNRDKRDFILLEEEVRHACVYAEIQATRYAARFMFRAEECPKDCRDISVPRLILQPLLENAIKYEVEKTERKGILQLSYEKQKDKLCVIIESSTLISAEDVRKMNEYVNSDDGKQEITSTINIMRRLKLYYGSQYQLIYERGKYGGLKSIVELDCRKRVKQI